MILTLITKFYEIQSISKRHYDFIYNLSPNNILSIVSQVLSNGNRFRAINVLRYEYIRTRTSIGKASLGLRIPSVPWQRIYGVHPCLVGSSMIPQSY